ncbi:hypothetical protein L798_15131 [Zootermopsis nevadensis]|uniref:Uncharacterized protein n=1 Tax=Zootermopsis nevadensis TaxID=136037 RepID=A0A067QMT8_ZOONE|nr:hypothetical protein L798_15131 [Zootermopsis nevadensis]
MVLSTKNYQESLKFKTKDILVCVEDSKFWVLVLVVSRTSKALVNYHTACRNNQGDKICRKVGLQVGE